MTELELADLLAATLRRILNGACHPEIALRVVMVDLGPVRAALKAYDDARGAVS